MPHQVKTTLGQNVRQCITYVLLCCLIVGGGPVFSFAAQAERGLHLQTIDKPAVEKVVSETGEEVLLYKESHALVIGISEYNNGWPKLPGVKKDIEDVAAALKAQGFDVVERVDVDKSGLDQAFTDFISKYGQNPENRLLFYFAGHGHTVKTTYGEEIGYIVPVDAPNPNYDLPTFQSKAMEMQQVEIYAKRIQSKHALFLFDACFSGSLFALSRAIPEVINYKTAQPVRQFITSGSANETVPDESIFRSQFVRAMQGDADRDQDGYVTGTELGEFLQNTVVNYSKNSQHPQYGKIRNPNLDKGDFVFLLPTRPQAEEPPQAIPTPIEKKFSLDDLTAWQTRLNDMENAFTQVMELEKQEKLSKDLKIEAWKRFVEAFAEDNPYATRDNDLLKIAGERIEYWQNYTLAPTPTPKPKPTFRVNAVVLKDSAGKAIQPVNNRYTVRQGEKIAIGVDVTAQGYAVEFSWTTKNGQVPPAVIGNSNTYTATTPGDDYVLVYVWDTTAGQQLSELQIALTVIPNPTPTPKPKKVIFEVKQVVVKDAAGKILKPVNDIYTIKQGETVTITVDVINSQGNPLDFSWTGGGLGKVAPNNKNPNTYTATNKGRDYVIVYIWDTKTQEELQFPINITVEP